MRSEDFGYVKIHRKILEWSWYRDINTCRLFIHMLLKANWKEAGFRDTTVPRGSFVSSLDKLSEETMLTKREIRTAISHLKSTGEVTVKTTNRYSIFSIKNYELYQCGDTQSDTELTDSRQPNDIPSTVIEENKKVRSKEFLTDSTESVRQTDVQRAVEAWNGLASFGVKPISRLSYDSKRYQSLAARIRQYGIDAVLDAIGKIKSSSFLQGKGAKGWTITFDWFVLPNNFPKVLEGNYIDNQQEQDRFSDRYHGYGAVSDEVSKIIAEEVLEDAPFK